MGLIRSPASYDKADRVLHALSAHTPEDPFCMPVHVIPNDDESVAETHSEQQSFPVSTASEGDTTTSDPGVTTETALPPFSTPLDFEIDDVHLIEPEEDEQNIEFDDPTVSLLQWHYRLNHVPFEKLKQMSQEGYLPGHLQRCRTPKCAACLYGKAAKRPWRTRAPPNRRAPPAVTGPGDCISIDQLESPTPGLIAQLRGFITKQRYTCTTVFVDYYSRLSFVYHQRSTKGNETLEAKRAFEAFAKSHGVTIKHYHADNGRFVERTFMDHCVENGQTISFCGVNAHWQNGIAEKRIRDLQDQARTMLVHAKYRWKAAINAHLWPYAIRMANDVHMYTPLKLGRTPIQLFSKVAQNTKMRHFHPFGCPVYVLDDKMQQGQKGPKWRRRARLGIYLGHSPLHSRSVALVLNITTGLCSPQFHADFDDFFETVKDSDLPVDWPAKCYFTPDDCHDSEQKEPPIPDTIVLPPAIALPEPIAQSTTQDSNVSEGAPPQQQQQQLETMQEPTNGTNNDASIASREPQQSSQPSGATIETITGIRRSTRTIRPPQRLIAETAFIAQAWDDVWDIQDFEIQDKLNDPIAFAASSNPDVMYYHEALKAPDRKQFIEAMKQEVADHEQRGHWELV